MPRGEYERAIQQDSPPYEAWFVVEVDLEHGRDDPLYASLLAEEGIGPFAGDRDGR